MMYMRQSTFLCWGSSSILSKKAALIGNKISVERAVGMGTYLGLKSITYLARFRCTHLGHLELSSRTVIDCVVQTIYTSGG